MKVYYPEGGTMEATGLTFEECQQLVGGLVELAYTKDKIFLCNEDGIHLNLPVNSNATIELHKEGNFKDVILRGNIIIISNQEAKEIGL